MTKKKRKSPAPAAPGSASTPVAAPTPVAASADETVAPSPHTSFPVVGIGASAGGLAAFEAFFSGMPADVDPGMAFVLVQHLDPNHKSILTEIVRRYTRMPVFEVADGIVVRPNCIYIIPPGRDMAFLNGALQLLEPGAPRGQRLPIDFFFRSLALDQHELAIGIVLSGTGSDGTHGGRAIKGEGGMVMAQSTASTEFDGMPRSAVATGLVDYELPPEKMPVQLIAYAAHAFGKLSPKLTPPAPPIENALKKIFILLRAQTGHDVSQYKPSTVHRRIQRRMVVHQIDTVDGYVKFLQQTPAEVEALFRDLLIGVTNFFRDPEAFTALEKQAIPRLFAGKQPGSTIRVWSPGCSTGEEAYSIAILLQEHMETLKQNFTVQLFATDIDSRAIATARAGLYPASIAADLTPQRLARFFTAEPSGGTYRIHKGIRDMLVFSEQNVIKDPPFSRIGLISCRNLMIYFNAQLQKKLIPLFHYALNPGGMLFLGTSEGVGDFNDLFTALDRISKLYQRKEFFDASRRAAFGPGLASVTAIRAALPRATGKTAFPGKLPLRELAEQALLQQVVQAGALVNGHGDILYLHGRTGMYLEPAPGETGVSNILKMAREGLRRDLTTALHMAVTTKEKVRHAGLRVKTNSHFTTVNLIVGPVPVLPELVAGNDPEAPLFLVILEEAPAAAGPATGRTGTAAGAEGSEAAPAPATGRTTGADGGTSTALSANGHQGLGAGGYDGPAAEALIAALNQELHARDEYLQTTREQMETTNEELKSSNEEMQSVNEELQSTNEELETAKEELQSVNEELGTVNNELHAKVADLSQSSNDMNNLLAGTGIGTVFLDHQLRILRFTPAASGIINLIAGDAGRPVSHIVSNLVGYDGLVADTQSVLDTLIPKELEVQTAAGAWYKMRIQPYRTLENVIIGAVISFFDISEMVRTREALHKANELLRLAVVVRDARDAITVQDLEGRIVAWNPGAVRLYGWSEAEALAMNVRDRIPQELREDALARVLQLSRAEVLEPHLTQRLAKGGAVVEVSIIATALVDEAGKMYAVATTERAKGS
ncbi:MAG: chemotaxis protein CheB [Candidatus Methylomirabilia bacterium]